MQCAIGCKFTIFFRQIKITSQAPSTPKREKGRLSSRQPSSPYLESDTMKNKVQLFLSSFCSYNTRAGLAVDEY